MLSRLEKKILQCKKVKIQGVKYEFKRCTPEDFLGKEGIPISKWQAEADFIANKEHADSITWTERQKEFKKVFSKAIVTINGQYAVPSMIDIILNNYYISNELYSEIMNHCLGLKKKTILLKLLAKQPA